MAQIQDPNTSSRIAGVGSNSAVYTERRPSGAVQYSLTAVTGTLGAALAANAPIFAMRMDPSASVARVPARITRVRIDYFTVVVYTTPVTIARSLALYRANSGTPAGGTNIPATALKDSTYGASEFSTAGGGLIQVATTAALTGLTLDTNPIRRYHLAQFGAANARVEFVWEFSPEDSAPIIIRPGESFVVGVGPTAMDAAGTWNALINVDWVEGE